MHVYVPPGQHTTSEQQVPPLGPQVPPASLHDGPVSAPELDPELEPVPASPGGPLCTVATHCAEWLCAVTSWNGSQNAGYERSFP